MIRSRVGRNFCPRCGSPLLTVGGKSWCSRCRTYPFERGLDISGVVAQLKGRLIDAIERIEKKLSGEPEIFKGGLYVPPRDVREPLPPPRVTLTSPGRVGHQPTVTVEEKVFKYIEDHDGTISLSQASVDLNMPPDELQAAIGRLRAAGFLTIQTEQESESQKTPRLRRTCVNCLRPIEDGARYCSACGFRQPSQRPLPNRTYG